MPVKFNSMEIKEYARELTGLKFWILDNVPSNLNAAEPVRTSSLFTRIARNDTIKQAKLADALNSLEKHGLIEMKWGASEPLGGGTFRTSKFVKRTDNGDEVMALIYQDSELKARALLLALAIRIPDMAAVRGVENLYELYEKIKVTDASFEVLQRDPSKTS